MLDIIRQIVAAGFLASLDQDHATRVRHPFLAQRRQRAERAEHRVAVVGAAAPVQLVALEARDPGAVSVGPARHFRLLVEVPIEQHGIRALPGNLDHNNRGPARQPDNLDRRAREAGKRCPRPTLEQRYGFVHISVHCPIRVEGRRFVRNFDVLDQRRNDLVLPAPIDRLSGFRDIDHLRAPAQRLAACQL